MSQFKPWDGSYEKTHYDVELHTGEVIKACWPNAGTMNATDGTGRRFKQEDVKAVLEWTAKEWDEFWSKEETTKPNKEQK